MRLRHEHVLPLYGVAHEFLSGTTVMVCPWLKNGAVTSFIASHPDMNVSRRLKLVGPSEELYVPMLNYIPGQRCRRWAPLS
jgi:hypothetical protein